MLNLRIIVSLIMLTMGIGLWGEHQKLLVTKAEFASFKAEAKNLADQQKAKILQLEKENEAKLHAAELARIDALNQLRHFQDLAHRNRLSVTPSSPEGSSRICFEREKFDGALQQFLADVEGLVTEGDGAIIDTRAWLAAWPK